MNGYYRIDGTLAIIGSTATVHRILESRMGGGRSILALLERRSSSCPWVEKEGESILFYQNRLEKHPSR